MGNIVVVGLGPGDIGSITLVAWNYLSGPNQVFLRTARHPMVEHLTKKEVKWESFDWVYDKEESFELVYERITQILLEQAAEKDIIYGVPGHPMVAETTVKMLLKQGNNYGIKINLVPGLSFLDACYHLIKLDPAEGLVVQDGLELTSDMLVLDKGQIICQVYNKVVASELKLTLMDKLAAESVITVITGAGVPDMETVRQIPLFQLDRVEDLNHLTSIYIPPQETVKRETAYSLNPIVTVMSELRSDGGCPWDREQTHESLQKYLIEETYEVIEAIEENNMYKLCDEMGDLLLQIVFHAQIAKENQKFDINDVVEAITAKMIRRHPHIYDKGDAESSEQVIKNWEQIKKEERLEQGITVNSLLNVPAGMPALMRAQKLQQQAARVGFDWPDITGVMDKISEEWAELEEAMAKASESQIKEEFGDVIFSLVNLARFLRIDAEEVLRQTCEKFSSRFNFMENEAKQEELNLSELNLQQLDKLWQKSKKSQKMRKKLENI